MSISCVEAGPAWEFDCVCRNVLHTMATKGLEHGLGTEKTNRRVGDVVAFYFNVMFTPLMVKDTPAQQSLPRNCIDAREITNLCIARGIRNEVIFAWGDAARCTSVHDERWRCDSGIGSECRFKKERK